MEARPGRADYAWDSMIGVWIGAAYSPDFSLNQAPSFIGGGVVIQGVVPSRPQDLLILGGSHAGLSSSAPPAYPQPAL